MLILTRRIGEAIDFKDTRRDEAIGSVVVLALPQRNIVRLGFEMERHIQVLRDDALKVRGGKVTSPVRGTITEELLTSVACEPITSDAFKIARAQIYEMLKGKADAAHT